MTLSVKLYKAEVRIYIVWKVLKIVLQENHHSRNRAKRYRALNCITYHVTNSSRKCHRLQFYRHKRYGASCLGFLSQISKILFLNPNMVQIYIRYVSTEDFRIGRLLWSWLYVCSTKNHCGFHWLCYMHDIDVALVRINMTCLTFLSEYLAL